MEFTAKGIAEFLHGEVEGDPNVAVHSVSKIEEGGEGTLSFLANPLYTRCLYSTTASIIIVDKNFKLGKKIPNTLIRVDDPYQAFASLLEFYDLGKSTKSGIDKLSFIDETAKLEENVYVGAFAYVGKNVSIGKNAKIYPHVYLGDNVQIKENTILRSGVKVYSNCKIGANCIIHSSVVVGGDGFGFAPQSDNNYKKVPQLGNVIIEDNVEIGANTTIDKATIGSTIIRRGVKLDNLIQIAHNVEIGENTVIAAQVGISGSTKIGKNCMIGGQVGISGHLTIADEVKISAQSGIGKSIKNKGEVVQGSPAWNAYNYQKSYVLFRKLPELYNKIEELEKEIAKLKNVNISI